MRAGAVELAVLSRATRWEEMPPRISDEVLHPYAMVGTTEARGALVQDIRRDAA